MFQQAGMPAVSLAAVPGAQAADPMVVNPPTDTVQALSWSSRANFLAGGAWDGVLRCWEVAPTGASQFKAETRFDGPVLDCSWHDDGSKIFAGSCDTTARCWDLATNQLLPVAKHDMPIKVCTWLPALQVLVTGSWDRTVKFWDCRQSQPALSFPMTERVYCADLYDKCFVVATADKQVTAFSLQGTPQQAYRQPINKLRLAPRCLAVLPGADGFAVGSVEGRVGIQYFDQARSAENFTFKCHNENDNFFCVNGISFHPRYGTFSTCGSDARFIFWDKNSRMRLKQFNPVAGPITTCKFNADGALLAYAIGYDWHKGHAFSTSSPNSVMIHVSQDSEIQPRASATAARPLARK